MRVIACVLLTVALAQAADWKPAHITPKLPLPFRRIPFHKPDSRITGGQEATPNSLPYQVGLLIPTAVRTDFCGGSLLSATTVVTAAHCAQQSNNITVVLGAHRIRDESEATQVVVQTKSVTVHPDWNSISLQNDIAILRIPEVTLSDVINTIRLPSRANANNDYVGDVATASGWGKPSDSATGISDVLNYVDVPVLSNRDCNGYYIGFIVDTRICTDGTGGKSTCNGDSGGPLRASTGELIGITSFGNPFGCEWGFPPVFTRVTEFIDWIGENSDVVVE